MLLWAVSVFWHSSAQHSTVQRVQDVRCTHSGRRLNWFGSLFEWYRMFIEIFTMWMDIGVWALTRNRFRFLFIFILCQLITHKSTYVYSLLLNRIESLWASQHLRTHTQRERERASDEIEVSKTLRQCQWLISMLKKMSRQHKIASHTRP